MTNRTLRYAVAGLTGAGLAAVLAVVHAAASGQAAGKAQTYKGLEIAVTGVKRTTNVSLRDCPPGENTVRGVIRPVEENEFFTVTIDVTVLPSYQPIQLKKPVLSDADGKAYHTAQAFAELNSVPSYSCEFAFRVPKGTKFSRFAIEDASFEIVE